MRKPSCSASWEVKGHSKRKRAGSWEDRTARYWSTSASALQRTSHIFIREQSIFSLAQSKWDVCDQQRRCVTCTNPGQQWQLNGLMCLYVNLNLCLSAFGCSGCIHTYTHLCRGANTYKQLLATCFSQNLEKMVTAGVLHCTLCRCLIVSASASTSVISAHLWCIKIPQSGLLVLLLSFTTQPTTSLLVLILHKKSHKIHWRAARIIIKVGNKKISFLIFAFSHTKYLIFTCLYGIETFW